VARELAAKIPQKPSLDVHGVLEPVTLRILDATIIFTIESAIAAAGKHTLDRSNVYVAASGVLAVRGTSRVGVFTFGPVLDAVERTYAELGFDRVRLDRWLRTPSLLPRTVWLHELLHRYVFERHALGKHGNLATEFLEIEIAKEVFYLFRDRESGDERASIVRTHSPQLQRALDHIEAHLADDVSAGVLARIAAASESTLLRMFKAELGCSPGAYWRNRKLDEALLWLRGGDSVADVAARAGYENPTAFGFAFRRRFGRPPSTFRPVASGSPRSPRRRSRRTPRTSPRRAGTARSG
jgi:AraC-like DNA-binding protein